MKRSFDFRSGWRRASRVSRWIFYIVISLIAARLALPYAVKTYVNGKLNEAGDYTGRVGDVNMKLWRGGYRIQQIQFFKKSGEVASPLFSAPEMDLSIERRELFHGAVVGEITIREPHINIVVGPTPEQTQKGEDERWDKLLRSLFPFKLNRVEISNGEIHFQNPFSKPPVDIYTSNIFATATNLTNARDLNQKLPSGVTARASTLGGGELNLQLQLDLLKPSPAYEINCGVTNVDLVALNDFLRAYGKFDVERGRFALYTSVAADNGSYEGYFKVFFENLDVFAWEKERKKNVLQVFWQAIVGSVAAVLKNHPKDQLATKIPISGTYTNSSVGVLTAIGTLLQNAFIHALVPKLDQHVTVEQVEKKPPKNEPKPLAFKTLYYLLRDTVRACLGGDFISGKAILLGATNFIISLGIITVLFAMIFKWLPDVRIAWRNGWLGGFVTALLFNLGKFLFSVYVAKSSLASVYRAVGSLVIVLLWVYYSAQILFFGAQFTFNYATRVSRKPGPARGAELIPASDEHFQKTADAK